MSVIGYAWLLLARSAVETSAGVDATLSRSEEGSGFREASRSTPPTLISCIGLAISAAMSTRSRLLVMADDSQQRGIELGRPKNNQSRIGARSSSCLCVDYCANQVEPKCQDVRPVQR